MNIAIDGPAGAGKSTIARRVAKELGYIYVDTGAMYRAMALHIIRNNVSGDDEAGISAACESADISLGFEGGEQAVYLNGENVNPLIRTPQVSEMASISSKNPRVREKLVSIQQELAKKTDVVMDGRDIGTRVLPDAPVKVYLTASADCRAKRRYDEMLEKGNPQSLEEIKQEIIERDERDMTREISPLVQAEDAALVDSSDMTIEEVTQAILKLVADSGK